MPNFFIHNRQDKDIPQFRLAPNFSGRPNDDFWLDLASKPNLVFPYLPGAALSQHLPKVHEDHPSDRAAYLKLIETGRNFPIHIWGKMSRYSSDSDRYITIAAERPRKDRRTSNRPEPVNNNFFLDVPDHGGRRRAASTGAPAQPINLIIGDNRSRSSSGSSDRRSHHSRRSTIHEDDLPYEIRRRLDIADEVEAEGRRRSRERRRDRSRDEDDRERRRERERLEDEIEERERQKKKEKERMREEIEEDKRRKEKERERILEEAKEAERQKKRDEEKQKAKWKEEEEEKERKKKKEEAEKEKAIEEMMKQKFRNAGMYDHYPITGYTTRRVRHLCLDHGGSCGHQRLLYIRGHGPALVRH